MPPPKPLGTPSADLWADLPDVTPAASSDIWSDLPEVSAPARARDIDLPIDRPQAMSTRPERWSHDEEQHFQRWYAGLARAHRLDPNPDAPAHHYNYRMAFRAGAEPGPDGHWPSAYKDATHPNRFVDGRDTITGAPTPSLTRPDPRALTSPLEQEVIASSPATLARGNRPDLSPPPAPVNGPLRGLELAIPVAEGLRAGAVSSVARPVAAAAQMFYDDRSGLNAISDQIALDGSPDLAADDWYRRPEAWANLAGSTIGSVVGFGAMSVGPGGPLRALLMESGVEAANTYADLREQGLDDATAKARALLSMAGNAALLKVTNHPLFEAAGGHALVKALKRFASEGVQEAGQEIIGNVATEQPWSQGVAQSFAAGGFAGPFMGAAHDALSPETAAKLETDDLASRTPTVPPRTEAIPVVAEPVTPPPSMADLVRQRVADSQAAREASQFPEVQGASGAQDASPVGSPAPVPEPATQAPLSDPFADLPDVGDAPRALPTDPVGPAPTAETLDYEAFKARYTELFRLANRYKPTEVGSRHYTDQMAALSDQYPEFEQRLFDEQAAERNAARPKARERITDPQQLSNADLELEIADAVSQGPYGLDRLASLKAERQRRLAARESEQAPATTHDYASTQVNLTTDVADRVRALAESIPDEDLTDDGRESEPHITVQYGLTADNADDVREALANEAPVTVTFGKTSLFENEDADVVKVDIESDDLRRLRAKIAKALDTPGDTHPTYIPHATVAYVKPGRGKAYADRTDLEGQTATIDRLTFSGKDGSRVDIPLNGPATAPPDAEVKTAPAKTWGTMTDDERAAEIARRLEARKVPAMPPPAAPEADGLATIEQPPIEQAPAAAPSSEPPSAAPFKAGDRVIVGGNTVGIVREVVTTKNGPRVFVLRPNTGRGEDGVDAMGPRVEQGWDLDKVRAAEPNERSEEFVWLEGAENTPPPVAPKKKGPPTNKTAEAKPVAHSSSAQPEPADIDAPIARGRITPQVRQVVTAYIDSTVGAFGSRDLVDAVIKRAAQSRTRREQVQSAVDWINRDVDRRRRETGEDVRAQADAAIALTPSAWRSSSAALAGRSPTASETPPAAASPSLGTSADTPQNRQPQDPAAVRERANAQVAADPDGLVDRYLQEFGRVLNADNASELFDDYARDPESRARNMVAVRPAAGAVVERAYQRLLDSPTPEGTPRLVTFTAGGNASGKSSGANEGGSVLVFDSTLSQYAPSKAKIDEALARGYDVKIDYTWRDPAESFASALDRAADTNGRTVSIKSLLLTHQGSRLTVLQLADDYANDPRVHVRVTENDEVRGLLPRDTAWLEGKAYTDLDGLGEQLQAYLDAEYDAGRVTRAVYGVTRLASATRSGGPPASGNVRSERVGESGPPRRAPSTPSVDVNAFGEAQPRLAGAEQARDDAAKPEPQFDAPFTLQAENAIRASERQDGLFGEPTTADRLKALEDKRASIERDKKQHLQELFDSLKKTQSGIDPSALVPMVKLIGDYLKLGLTTLESAWVEFQRDWAEARRMGATALDVADLRDAFEIGWEMAQEDRSGVNSDQDADESQPPTGSRRSGSRGRAPRGRSAAGGSDERRTDGDGDRGTRADRPELVTARGALTPDADAALVPADLADRLYPHQVTGTALALASMRAHGGFLLADGTGAGKTSQILAVAETYRRAGQSVLVVTKAEVIKPQWAKRILSGSFVKDAARLQLPVRLVREQADLPSDAIGITTYERVGDFTDVDVVLFDESHALKNAFSGRGMEGTRLAANAQAVLFASATPADKPLHIPYLERMGMLEGQTPQQAMLKLGLREVEREVENPKTGEKRTIRLYQPTVSAPEIHRRMSDLFDRMTQAGRMVKREISMAGVDVAITRVTLPDETKALLDSIEAFYAKPNQPLRGLQLARVLMRQRRQQEPAKVPIAMHMIREEIDAGRQVVLFAARVNESEVGKWVKNPFTGESERVVLTSSEGTLKTIREQLRDAGVTFAELHGGADEKPADAMEAFQSGQARVLIATIESGGTGINLDDVVGDAPRTMIIMTAPFSAVENVQAAGRVWRVTTKSFPRLRYIFGDTAVDAWNSSIIASKMAALGATVKGEVERLDPNLIDFIDVEDVAPEPKAPAEPPAESGWTRGALGEWRINDRGNVEVRFKTVPPTEVRERLKAAGFRWYAQDKVWYVKGATEASRMVAVGAVGSAVAEDHGVEAESGTWTRVLAEAKAEGYTGSAATLRDLYDTYVSRDAYMRELADDETQGNTPQQLLTAIVKFGGLKNDGSGEIHQLWEASPGYVKTNYKGAGKPRFDKTGRLIDPKRYRKMPTGSLGGVANVLRNDGTGLTLDGMAEALRQLPLYREFHGPQDVLDAIDQALLDIRDQGAQLSAFVPRAGWWREDLTDDGQPLSRLGGATDVADAVEEDATPARDDEDLDDSFDPSGWQSRRQRQAGTPPLQKKRGPGRPGKVPTGQLPGVVRPFQFPELLELAKTLIGTPQVVKRFRGVGTQGDFREHRGIRLHADLFKAGQEQELAETLAHEIGHLVDWLPDRTMKRGNLLGRLESLRGFLKHTFNGPAGTIKVQDIRDELIAVSDEWRPWNPQTASESFKKYRHSGAELYADALSALLNDPGWLEAKAPTFYREFFAALHKKPSVQMAYVELQAVLGGTPEEIIERRRAAVQAMFERGDLEAAAVARTQLQRAKDLSRDLWTALKTQTLDKHAPFQSLAKRHRIAAAKNPAYFLEERNYLGGKLKAWVQRHVQPLKDVVETAGLGWHTFGEALFYERIIAGDRSEIANPLGLSPDAAKASYDALRKGLDPDQVLALDHAIGKFRAAVKAVAKTAYEVGLFTDEQWDTIQKNPAYATFQVIEHLDKAVSSRIKHQIGTLKDVTNPANATILKTLVTLRAIEHQRVKSAAIAALEQHEPGAVQPAKTRWNGKTHEPMDPQDKALRLVTLFKHGKHVGYYVDRYIADSLENTSIGHTWAVVRILRSANSSWFRPIFTSLNLGFQVFNVARDFLRFWKNTPTMTLRRAMVRYYQAIPVAKARAFGLRTNAKALETVLQAEETGIFSQTFNDTIHEREVQDVQIDDIMGRVGLGPPKATPTTASGKALAFGASLLEKIEQVGDFIETLPKAAAIEEFRGTGQVKDLTADQRSFIRRKVGSPDFLAGGTFTPVTNNVFLFSNAILQAWRADLEVATDPATRAGWMWKTVLTNVLPKVLMGAAMAGMFKGDDDDDDWLQRIFAGVSDYNRTNYTIIPLGFDQNGVPMVLRLPQDDSGRLVGGLAWKAMRLAMGDRDVLSMLRDVASYTVGQAPQVTPAIGLPVAVGAYLTGQNPYDAFRGRFVFTKDEWAAQTWQDTHKKFIGWVFQQAGGGLVWRFVPGDTPTKTKSAPQLLVELPIASNILGRVLVVSNYGEAESLRAAQADAERAAATRRLTERRAVSDLLEDGLTRTPGEQWAKARDLAERLYPDADAQERARATSRLQNRLALGTIRANADPLTEALLYATSNAEKVSLLREGRKRMAPPAWAQWRDRARQQGVLSVQVEAALQAAAQ